MEIAEVIGRPVYGKPALVVVPKLDRQDYWKLNIKPGSGMVAFQASDSSSVYFVYYEGNLYNACNLQTFEDRAVCAYGRMAMSYPTTAVCAGDMDGLEVIGTVTPQGIEIEETEAYKAWVALDKTLVEGVRT